MDQEKIGKFIACQRKENGYTQAALAERLGITDRAVSKWERGKSMPDPSIMLDLCGLLKISVNELLTGERLTMEDYQEQAEKNLMELTKQEEANNARLLMLEQVIIFMATASLLAMIFAASFAVVDLIWQIMMIIAGLIIFAVGIVAAIKIEHDAGYYECPNCGKRYLPTMKAVVFAPHIGLSRRMKCPCCEKRGYHKKVLTK